jgi:hypothetical protein
MTDEPALAAGDFSSWVVEMQAAIRGERAADVPCDGCTACCTASHFVHIEPDETDTLARIPAALLFPAPRMPRGNMMLGYDERGHCPMLVDGKCSIYDDRPRACRTYDCRIFAAADLSLDDDDRALIAERVRRWRFSYPTRDDRDRQAAVRAAARYLEEHGEPATDAIPTTVTGIAVRAIELHEDFLP